MSDRNGTSDMEDLLLTFTSEGQELLDEVEPRLIELQECSVANGGVNGEVLNSIFRIFHTIKGSAGFLELNSLQEVTHEAETLLDHYRKGRVNPSVEQIGLLLQTTDFIRKLLANIERYMHDRGFEPEARRLKQDLARAFGKTGNDSTVNAGAESPVHSERMIPDAPLNFSPENPLTESSENTTDECVASVRTDAVARYVPEAMDLLDGLERIIPDLEKDPGNQALLNGAFSNMHMIRISSGLLQLNDLEKLSHKTESFLDHARQGNIRIMMETAKMLSSIFDYLRSTIKELPAGGDGKVRGCDILMGFIDEVIAEELGQQSQDTDDEPRCAESLQPPSTPPETIPSTDLVIPQLQNTQILTDELPRESNSPSSKDLQTSPVDAAPKTPDSAGSATARKDIRVDLEKVDKLVDLVGELALAEMMVVQNPALRGLEAEEFERAVHHLDRVISELQYVSMSLRMVPIAATFRKLIRLVHDLSYKSSKNVKLVTVGEETEVDKTVVDHIADPLVHIVRNAIDHGIELPEDRKTAGKKEFGTVTIEAKHEGGEVWIEVRDDGRGLSREKILKKARQMGMVSGEGTELRDEEVFKYIMEPGFSTADRITEVSGRGVGMDVVKRNLEKINGQVDVSSTPGRGSRFTLRIPLTLALMDGMLVQVGGTRYIMPLLSIRECIRPRREDITVTPDGQEVVQVRSELIPVIRLHQLHHITPEHEALEESLLLVVEHRGKVYCIVVDGVLGQQQAVIKGLSEYVGNVRGASGCTILGDGTVSLILDVGSLLEMVFREREEQPVIV